MIEAWGNAQKSTLGDIKWEIDSHEVRTLARASKLFYERLILRNGYRERLLEELKTYSRCLTDDEDSPEQNHFDDVPAVVPADWPRLSAAAEDLANLVYATVETITATQCGCSPSPHGFEMRLPLLGCRLPREHLKMQIRRPQDVEWQHAWVKLTKGQVTKYSHVFSTLTSL